MPHIARLHLLIALTLATGGCGAAVRSQATTLGDDVVGAMRETEPELFEIERRLADSMAGFVGRAFEDKVLSRASGVWDTMLLKMNEQSRVVVGGLAQGVERDLNRSLQVMLSENMELATRQASPLIDTAMSALERGMRDKLQPVLIEILKQAADSASGRLSAIDSMLAQSRTGKQASKVLYILLAGLGVIIIGGGLVWRRNEVRNKQAFRAAKAALESGAPFQRDAVQQTLRNQGFTRQADWLK
jgi:hypothetical protein